MSASEETTGRRNIPNRQVTLEMVAKRAKVSIGTASLILSGRKDRLAKFRPATVEKVQQTAERLGYRANLFASSLSTRESPFFGLVIRDFGRQNLDSWHHWAFEGQFVAGVSSVAADKQLYPLLACLDPFSPDAGVGFAEKVLSSGVLGAIVRAQNHPLESHLWKEVRRGSRIVAVFPDQISRWKQNAIIADNETIGEMAARLLMESGRTRWGIVRYLLRKGHSAESRELRSPSAMEKERKEKRAIAASMIGNVRRLRESHALRIRGFCRMARQFGASVTTLSLPREMNEATAPDWDALRNSRVDGIFALDSVLSINTLLACRKVGLDMPRDVALVGVNCSRWEEVGLPRITSIDISWRDVGRLALEKLVELAGKGENIFDTISVTPMIVAGQTCNVHSATSLEGAGT